MSQSLLILDVPVQHLVALADRVGLDSPGHIAWTRQHFQAQGLMAPGVDLPIHLVLDLYLVQASWVAGATRHQAGLVTSADYRQGRHNLGLLPYG